MRVPRCPSGIFNLLALSLLGLNRSLFCFNICAEPSVGISMINSQLMVFLTAGFARPNLLRGFPPIASCLTLDGQVKSFGVNTRFPLNDPTARAEMICLCHRKSGNLKPTDFRRAIFYTTLSPCWMCVGAILMLGIKTVVIGENTTFKGPEDVLKSNGVQVFNLESRACIDLMRRFQKRYPGRWKKVVGQP